MLADAAHPARGSFVRDQVVALRSLDGVEVELHEFAPGPPALARAAVEMRRRYGGPSTLSRRPASSPFDVVHAHFGLSAWPALAVPAAVRALTAHGNDLAHPRTRLVTAAVLPLMNLLAGPSEGAIKALPSARARERAQVLPCGADLERFKPLPRSEARAQLGLDPARRLLLLPADPARAEKRADRARLLAGEAGAELLTLGSVAPERVPLWVNAADAVLVPSEREGFGLAVIEALACDVPVLATPVGVHEEALAGIPGTLCAPFELSAWSAALGEVLRSPDPRVEGRARAQRYSSRAMAERVLSAWERALAQVSGSR
jgi:glycosyltransferase involved in cell wall biosynthesis